MIKEERKKNNPLAAIIHKINFERNLISLILDAEEDTVLEIDDKLINNFNPVMQVDIDLSISAHLNVMRYFEIKKSHTVRNKRQKMQPR